MPLALAGRAADGRSGGRMAEQFGRQFEVAGQAKEAVRAWNFLAWAFATSPDPQTSIAAEAADLWIKEIDRLPDIRDPEQVILPSTCRHMTKQQDPLSLDTLAAAQAAGGRFDWPCERPEPRSFGKFPRKQAAGRGHLPSVCSTTSKENPTAATPTAAIGREGM